MTETFEIQDDDPRLKYDYLVIKRYLSHVTIEKMAPNGLRTSPNEIFPVDKESLQYVDVLFCDAKTRKNVIVTVDYLKIAETVVSQD